MWPIPIVLLNQIDLITVLQRLLSSSELRKLFKYNILKDKQEGASRVFIAIDEKLYAFYNIRLCNKLVKQLFPDKIFLNKDDYHDPLKNIEELLFSL